MTPKIKKKNKKKRVVRTNDTCDHSKNKNRTNDHTQNEGGKARMTSRMQDQQIFTLRKYFMKNNVCADSQKLQ